MTKLKKLKNFKQADFLYNSSKSKIWNRYKTKKTFSFNEENVNLYNQKIKALKSLLNEFKFLKKNYIIKKIRGVDKAINKKESTYVNNIKLYNINSENFYQILTSLKK